MWPCWNFPIRSCRQRRGGLAIDTAFAARTRDIIERYFPLTPVPGIPEIRLHTAGPKSGLWRLADRDPAFGTPYWAYGWGGGLALARHILDHPEIVAGRRVLDAGTGSGLVGIAAAKAGAATVAAFDIDTYAVIAADLNARANGVAIRAQVGDILTQTPQDVELVLVADLFYDAAIASRTLDFLERVAAASIDALIGDPGRAFLPRTRLKEIARYAGGDFAGGAKHGSGTNAVYAFIADR